MLIGNLVIYANKFEQYAEAEAFQRKIQTLFDQIWNVVVFVSDDDSANVAMEFQNIDDIMLQPDDMKHAFSLIEYVINGVTV